MTKSELNNHYKRQAKFRNYKKVDNSDNTIGWVLSICFLLGCIIFVSIN